MAKDWEGCGSVAQGGLFAMVSRPESIQIQAYNEHAEPFILQTSGLLARVIQHETDHLDGIMFTDIAEIKTLIDRDAYLKIKRIRLKQKTLTQPLISIPYFCYINQYEKILIILFVVTFVLLGWYTSKNLPKILKKLFQPETTAVGPRNTTYMIEGKSVTLVNGYNEESIDPNSTTKIVTKYFGNELETDLNNDGRKDVVF